LEIEKNTPANFGAEILLSRPPKGINKTIYRSGVDLITHKQGVLQLQKWIQFIMHIILNQ
jgi:hypothetical protein